MSTFYSTPFSAAIGRKSLLFGLAPVLLITAGCTASPQTYIERGNRFAVAGKYDDAMIQYRKALQEAPAFGEAHYRLGLAALKKNLPIDAYQELHRAGVLMPD